MVYYVQVIVMVVFVVGAALAEAKAADIGRIQIIVDETKSISWIIPNRNLTAIQYTVQLHGFYLECTSITIRSDDGSKLSHAYNKCVEHVNGAR